MRLNRVLAGFLLAGLPAVASVECRATVLTMAGDVSASANASPPPAGGNSYGPLGNGSTIVSEYGDFVGGPAQTDVPSADFGAPPWWYNFSYGDNGEGYTPNVSVGKLVVFQSTGGLNTSTATRSWTAAGDRSLISYPAAGTTTGGQWYWTFTADPGYTVKLISADLVRFNSTTLNATVNVYSGNDPLNLGALLYSSGALAVNNVAQTISPGVSASSLTLQFDLPAGDALFNWAADNIVFSQAAIPEPATLTLGATAMIAAAALGRRRKA